MDGCFSPQRLFETKIILPFADESWNKVNFASFVVCSDILSIVSVLLGLFAMMNDEAKWFIYSPKRVFTLWLIIVFAILSSSVIIKFSFYIQNTNRTDWTGFIICSVFFVMYILCFVLPVCMLWEIIFPFYSLFWLLVVSNHLKWSDNLDANESLRQNLTSNTQSEMQDLPSLFLLLDWVDNNPNRLNRTNYVLLAQLTNRNANDLNLNDIRNVAKRTILNYANSLCNQFGLGALLRIRDSSKLISIPSDNGSNAKKWFKLCIDETDEDALESIASNQLLAQAEQNKSNQRQTMKLLTSRLQLLNLLFQKIVQNIQQMSLYFSNMFWRSVEDANDRTNAMFCFAKFGLANALFVSVYVGLKIVYIIVFNFGFIGWYVISFLIKIIESGNRMDGFLMFLFVVCCLSIICNIVVLMVCFIIWKRYVRVLSKLMVVIGNDFNHIVGDSFIPNCQEFSALVDIFAVLKQTQIDIFAEIIISYTFDVNKFKLRM